MLTFDEKHLIERTQAGDPEAFNPLVEKYQSRLYIHITRRVPDAEVAKALTQETWLRAYRAMNTFHGTSAFYSWLYRIAENVCIDYFRKQKHETEPLHLVEERRVTQTHPCPSRDVERAELRKHLRAAIQQLTPIRRQVFLLYYAQDMSIKQIATRLNCSEGTIKSHLRNTRLQLREHLTPFFYNDADF